ncbi:MAG: CRISPR-associated helicase Cas3', partial [Gemmatimonadaceae bacterium]
ALVALHDLGKFAPGFQAKAPTYWPAALGACEPERIVGGHHTDDGYVLWHWRLARSLTERIWPTGGGVLRALAPGLFGHHGRPVGGQLPVQLPAQRFGSAGTAAALACADLMVALLFPDPIDAPGPNEENARLASWRVAGLVTVADWVGSSQHWFPYAPPLYDDPTLARYWEIARTNASRAIPEAGLVVPAVAAAKSFRELTRVGTNASPVQLWAEANATVLPSGPLLVILEDVTGAGKTETAQMLVHRLMREGRATGAYWAMPTQATANAMYDRQASALDALYAADGRIKPSLVLAHGQQRLHERFRASVLGAAPEGPEADERAVGGNVVGQDAEIPGTAACAAFLADDRRAALLADVGAGTVDQALLGILPSKFNTVRLFGLADKVLVVDEAHAYDAYMGVQVQELLRFQAALGGCAVVLSATLSRKQRGAMVSAWQDGLGGGQRSVGLAGASPHAHTRSEAYPLATLVGAGAVREDPLDAAPWSYRSVPVRLVHDLDAAITSVVSAAKAGAAVAWVRNTVDDSIAAAALLRERGVAPLLFHARFAQADRQQREQEVLALFGKRASNEKRAGRVLVATQVIEQSLDLDFDAMVSDIAPVDLLVQRAGRLQRHEMRQADRPPGLPLELVVLSPRPDDNPPPGWLGGDFTGTSHVYEDAGVLWRTVDVLWRVGAIKTPGGLRDLVERVYGSSDVPPSLSQIAVRAEGKESANAATATYATLKVTDGYEGSAHAWLSDLRVPTRLADQQTVVRLARVRDDGALAPWAPAEGPAWKTWALSEVRLSARRVPIGATAEPRYASAVEGARATWGRFERALPVLPLEEGEPGVWRGTLLVSKGAGTIAVQYTAQEGLFYRPDR